MPQDTIVCGRKMGFMSISFFASGVKQHGAIRIPTLVGWRYGASSAPTVCSEIRGSAWCLNLYSKVMLTFAISNTVSQLFSLVLASSLFLFGCYASLNYPIASLTCNSDNSIYQYKIEYVLIAFIGEQRSRKPFSLSSSVSWFQKLFTTYFLCTTVG